MSNIEITLAELLSNYDWAEVFADQSSGNTDKTTEPVPPDSSVDTSPASREDVVRIIAAVNGENDGQEWLGLFQLKDRRYLVASGGCDYTGWDCQAGNHMAVSSTLEDAIRFGLTDSERERLGLESTSD